MQSLEVKSIAKEIFLSTGLYRPARHLYRLFNRTQLTHFQREVSFYSQLLSPGNLCFDVGANIGEKTEALLRAGAKVIAFEPQPKCIREIKARCSHYGTKFHVIQSAIGADPGEATLHIRDRCATSSLHQDWEGSIQSSIQVPVTTLDQTIDEFGRPDYCKIDVEGWEFEVLKGLSQPLPLLSLEYHLGEREVGIARACIDYLSSLGTIVINMTPAETPAFAFQEWLFPGEFLKLFPHSFRDRENYIYGDIWIHSL